MIQMRQVHLMRERCQEINWNLLVNNCDILRLAYNKYGLTKVIIFQKKESYERKLTLMVNLRAILFWPRMLMLFYTHDSFPNITTKNKLLARKTIMLKITTFIFKFVTYSSSLSCIKNVPVHLYKFNLIYFRIIMWFCSVKVKVTALPRPCSGRIIVIPF